MQGGGRRHRSKQQEDRDHHREAPRQGRAPEPRVARVPLLSLGLSVRVRPTRGARRTSTSVEQRARMCAREMRVALRRGGRVLTSLLLSRSETDTSSGSVSFRDLRAGDAAIMLRAFSFHLYVPKKRRFVLFCSGQRACAFGIGVGDGSADGDAACAIWPMRRRGPRPGVSRERSV